MGDFGPECPPCRYDPCACEEGVRFQQEGWVVAKYRTIVVDPPWAYNDTLGYKRGSAQFYTGQKAATPRAAAANYDTLACGEISRLPVADWADVDAHLYLWTTNSFIVQGHELVTAWGFQYKTMLTWVKPQIGMGHYYRNNTEHILFAVRGKLGVLRHDVPTAFTANRGKHSEKPAAFYDMVESMSPGPYLDVFARKLRFNWSGWGDGLGADYAPLGLPTPDQVRARKR